MKSFFCSLGFFAFLLLCPYSISFQADPAARALQQVTTCFHKGLNHLSTALDEYLATAQLPGDQGGSAEALRQAHLKTRLAFKEIEVFLEYFDHDGVKKHINGPPLPAPEANVPEIRIIPPSGLQRLDELLFSEEVESESETILALVKDLKQKFKDLKTYQQGIHIQHRYVFEASRRELIRIFTLGLTGFDTPGSAHAIPEALQAMRSLAQMISYYYPLLDQQAPVIGKQLQNRFDGAIFFLERSGDFDTFDRLAFLKDHLNPLYSLLYDAHTRLGIETINETTPLSQPTNYQARDLFADDFLNPGYFVNIKPENLTPERVELGRLLFFDPILSGNQQRSCASCHQPEKAFTDGFDKSPAIDGKGKIRRNAPTLVNAIFSERYFYDLREPELERQINHVVLDSLEFNTNFLEIVEKLKGSREYQQLFAEAYAGYAEFQLSKWSVSNALACFVASLHSFNSPFDRYVRGEQKEIDPAVKRGFNLFMGKAACGACHFAPVFNGTVPPLYEESESEVLGVPSTADHKNPSLDTDLGRLSSGRPWDEAPFYAYSFKTTTVRNIALTAPYMHNGVYHTLEEAIDFYNKGGGSGLGLTVPYQTLPDRPLELNEEEIADLIAFLRSLTDISGMTAVPQKLPPFEKHPEWNDRKIGGSY